MHHQPSSLKVKLTGLPGPSSYAAAYDDDPSGEGGHHELCLIDAGVRSMLDVPLSGGQNIQTLNLHCNHIRQIENLQVRLRARIQNNTAGLEIARGHGRGCPYTWP